MAAKDIRFSEDARAKVLKGVKLLADTVTCTLGAQGPQCGAGRNPGAPPP